MSSAQRENLEALQNVERIIEHVIAENQRWAA
jgi:hypothetical protein